MLGGSGRVKANVVGVHFGSFAPAGLDGIAEWFGLLDGAVKLVGRWGINGELEKGCCEGSMVLERFGWRTGF